MNPPSGPISSAPTVPTLSGVPPRPAADTSIIAPVSFAARAAQFVSSVRGKDDAGLIVLTCAPRLPHRTASAITFSEFARLDIW
jgi:hypothetical protein